MKNEDIKEELLRLSKPLADLPKVEKQGVPADYFNNLPSLTWNKIATDTSSTTHAERRIVPIWGKLAGVAASFALLFSMFQQLSLDQPQDDLPLDAVVEYFIDNVDELDEEFLFEIHVQSLDLAELGDDALDYILEEDLEMIDDQILEALY